MIDVQLTPSPTRSARPGTLDGRTLSGVGVYVDICAAVGGGGGGYLTSFSPLLQCRATGQLRTVRLKNIPKPDTTGMCSSRTQVLAFLRWTFFCVCVCSLIIHQHETTWTGEERERETEGGRGRDREGERGREGERPREGEVIL